MWLGESLNHWEVLVSACWIMDYLFIRVKWMCVLKDISAVWKEGFVFLFRVILSSIWQWTAFEDRHNDVQALCVAHELWDSQNMGWERKAEAEQQGWRATPHRRPQETNIIVWSSKWKIPQIKKETHLFSATQTCFLLLKRISNYVGETVTQPDHLTWTDLRHNFTLFAQLTVSFRARIHKAAQCYMLQTDNN